MNSRFYLDVQEIVGPALAERGFVLDAVDDHPDGGGRERHVAYYRSVDCKVQIYESSRDGEVNVMIAPVDAPNEFGLQAKMWQFLGRFAARRDLPLDEVVSRARTDYESYQNPLEWVRDRLVNNFKSARTDVLSREI